MKKIKFENLGKKILKLDTYRRITHWLLQISNSLVFVCMFEYLKFWLKLLFFFFILFFVVSKSDFVLTKCRISICKDVKLTEHCNLRDLALSCIASNECLNAPWYFFWFKVSSSQWQFAFFLWQIEACKWSHVTLCQFRQCKVQEWEIQFTQEMKGNLKEIQQNDFQNEEITYFRKENLIALQRCKFDWNFLAPACELRGYCTPNLKSACLGAISKLSTFF